MMNERDRPHAEREQDMKVIIGESGHRIPNASTRKALADAEARRRLSTHASLDDLFADLKI